MASDSSVADSWPALPARPVTGSKTTSPKSSVAQQCCPVTRNQVKKRSSSNATQGESSPSASAPSPNLPRHWLKSPAQSVTGCRAESPTDNCAQPSHGNVRFCRCRDHPTMPRLGRPPRRSATVGGQRAAAGSAAGYSGRRLQPAHRWFEQDEAGGQRALSVQELVGEVEDSVGDRPLAVGVRRSS